MRLAPTATSTTADGLTIPKKVFVAFMEAINFESPLPEEDRISFAAFEKIVNEKVGSRSKYLILWHANMY